MEAPRLTYLIASTMRTGSYLLCEGLEATGVAGHPREIFCPERRGNYAGEWHLPEGVSLDDYAYAAVKNSTTENGVCGMKIHGHHIEPLAREVGWAGAPWQVLRWIFPSAKYIHLTRRNRRAQAISWHRAVVTNQWWKIPGVADWELTGKQPEFDGTAIREREVELERQDRAWENFFAAGPCEVLRMEYEALAADYRNEVARALAFIGQDPIRAKDLPEPRLVRQADALSGEWERRMEVEYPK
jgi:LPS sulfotransferase NodH